MPVNKVLYISTASNISGATLALLEIIDEVKTRGIEPIVITAERGPLEKKLHERNVCFYKARYASWLGHEGELDTIFGKSKYVIKKILENYSENVICSVLKKESPDIVHINTGISPVGLMAAHKFNIPVIWHIREIPWVYWNRKPYNSWREVDFLRKADVLIAISDYVKREYNEKSPHNIIRLYDGVDTVKYNGLRKGDIFSSSIIRLSLCGGYEEKGHTDAIRAVKTLLDNGVTNFKLSFWGKFISSYKAKLELLIKNLNVENWITFEGQTDQMPQRWAETDIALICSTGEAFGRVTVEAMASGALLIGADAGATPELLSNEKGLLYEQGNAKDLAEKIGWAIRNKEEARNIAKTGCNYINTGIFSMDNYIDSLFSIYNRAIAKRMENTL